MAWVPGSRSKFGNWTSVPSLYSWNIAECDVKPQSTTTTTLKMILIFSKCSREKKEEIWHSHMTKYQEMSTRAGCASRNTYASYLKRSNGDRSLDLQSERSKFGTLSPLRWFGQGMSCSPHRLVKADMKSYKSLETAAIFYSSEPFLKQGIS